MIRTNIQTKPNPTQLKIFVGYAHVPSVQSAHLKASPCFVTHIYPDGIVGHNASVTRMVWIEFQKSHEQG